MGSQRLLPTVVNKPYLTDLVLVHERIVMADTPPVASVRRERAYQSFILLPPLVLAVVLGVGMWHEFAAKRQVQATIAEYRLRNEPVDYPSFAEMIDAETTRQSSHTWQTTAASAMALLGKYDMSIVKDAQQLVPQKGKWRAKAFTQELSAAAQPILNELRELEPSNKPVWLPELIDARFVSNDVLNQMTALHQLTANEFRVAYHAGDSERAAEALSLMTTALRCSNWQDFSTAMSLQWEHLAQRNRLISDSLTYDFWSKSELEQLRAMLQPEPAIDAQWRRLVDALRAMDMVWLHIDESMDHPIRPAHRLHDQLTYSLTSSSVLARLELLDQIAAVPNAGTSQHDNAIIRLVQKEPQKDPQFTTPSIVGLPYAVSDFDYQGYYRRSNYPSSEMDHSESVRRRVLAAVQAKLAQ